MRLPGFLLALMPAAAAAQAPTVWKDFTVGCEECAGALQFTAISDLAVSPRGEVLVTDRDAPMLRVFDGRGEVIWQGGTRGRGPGEYQFVLRAAFTPDGVALVDMLNSRVTTLSASYALVGTSPLGVFVTTAGTDGSGTLVLGAESPTGAFRALRWRAGELSPISLPPPLSGTTFQNSSIALAPNGVIAVLPHPERYEILRLDATGARLADLRRDVERVRRTPAEEAALQQRLASRVARVAGEAGASGRDRAAASTPPSTLSLKPHVVTDAMRFDPRGRLWLRTMRGTEAETIFDVFGASGAFLGSVTIPGEVGAFALGGTWLATAAENEDGVPQVTRWSVR